MPEVTVLQEPQMFSGYFFIAIKNGLNRVSTKF